MDDGTVRPNRLSYFSSGWNEMDTRKDGGLGKGASSHGIGVGSGVGVGLGLGL